MKLSERLDDAVMRLYEDGMDTRSIADILREAAELARRVEGSESIRVIGTGFGSGWGDIRFAGKTAVEIGQRVRLVPEVDDV